eukprot:TRINITY_DN4891_c0_g1_i1.p1 TRINITY_DN4891_c0_g1~~TRINITY_DN4891_c0_g1_i1.p1  ORF type:complete len:165 (+),score=45.34 TRINITY_DN4891_c0_g1_i1:118-612(+)
MASINNNNYFAAIAPQILGKENKKKVTWNPRLPQEKKTGTVQATLETLFTAGRWIKDSSLVLPKVLPSGTPMINFRINTHHGKNFTVMEGTPEIKDGFLWLGIKLPQDLKEAALRAFCVSATEFIVGKMKFYLEKLGAHRINASIMMKKPSASEITLYVVVAFE